MQDESVIETGAEIVGDPIPEIKADLRAARELIPVGSTGAMPMNLAQQIDYAQVMVRAKAAIPQHLQGNVGDCLAVIDIASRVGLSPYMVANKTYVQNGRLCFESQLYHSFVQASGLLDGDLHVEYEGEGEDTICIVTGKLKGDPRPKVHTSEKLKDARPALNERGQIKGSPLWSKKPRVQLFYDTSRDWVRIYAPRATLGIYTPDEIEQYGFENAKDVTPGIGSRLANGSIDRTEGHREGHADAELDQIATQPKGQKPQIADSEKAKRKKKAKDAGEELPKTPDDCLIYTRSWIFKETDPKQIEQRWTAEHELRVACGLTADETKPLEEDIATRLANLTRLV